MSEYLNLKIKEVKIKNLKKSLQSKGINPRSNAEAVNILIDNFLLNNDFNVNHDKTAKVGAE